MTNSQSRDREIGQPVGPVPKTAGESAVCAAELSSPPAPGFREEFLASLTENPQQKPLYQFRARAVRSDTVPHFALAYPLGDVLALPGFLVFLTDNDQAPGLGQLFNSVVGQFGTQLVEGDFKALIDMVRGSPCNLLQNEEMLSKALQSPNSFFVPFREITAVEYHKAIFGYRSSRIRIACRKESYVICQDEKAEGPLNSMKTWFTGWHPEFRNLLAEAAKKNADGQQHQEK